MISCRKKWHSYLAVLLTVLMMLSSLPVGIIPVTGAAAADTVTGATYGTTASAVYSPYWQSGKLTVGNLSLNSLTLSWSGAADNVGVTGYNIYQDGTLLSSNTNFNPFYVNGLQPGTQYTFTVQALNAAGLESTEGPSVTVTTHSLNEKIIGTATVDTAYLYADHITKVNVGGLDAWLINVPNATIIDGSLSFNDISVTADNLPYALKPSKVDDHTLKITLSGSANTAVTLPLSLTVSINPSAVSDTDMTASDPIQLSIKEVTDISLNKAVHTFSKGSSEQLIATVTPADAPDKTVNWTTSDSSIATVDSTGKVTAIGTGTATITATVASGLSAGCAVTVTPDATQTPVTVDNLYTDHVGKKITVKFGKAMADPTGTEGQFTVKVDGTAVSVTKVAPGSNPNEIVLNLANSTGADIYGNIYTVLLSYTKGTVAATDGSFLDSFTDYAVTSNYLTGGIVDFSLAATELSYDDTNMEIKLRYDDPVDYDNVTEMTWNFSNAFGRDGSMFIPNLTNYVKFYEKDTGEPLALPLDLWSNVERNWGQTDDWYYTRSGQGVTVGLNLTTCALKPSTTYVIDFLKGFTYNNGTSNTITDSFEFTTTSTSSSKPVWPADENLSLTSPSPTSVTLNWPEAQYRPTSSYPAGWPATDYHRGVTGYNIYQDDTLLTTADENATSYQVTNLAPGTTYQLSVKAVDLAGQLSDPLPASYNAMLLTPPVVTVEAPSQTGSAVNLTFTDDAAWRAAITGITVDGTPLSRIQYTVTAGNINLAPGVLNTDADHTIVISATNYQDTTVVQSTATTPPALTANEILPGSAVDLTFTDNPAWRAAVSGITVDDAVYLTGSQYVITAGHIYIVAGILNTAGDHTITVSAINYADTSVTQTVAATLTPPTLTTQEAYPATDVDVTFTDDPAWRAAISGAAVDGKTLTGSQYVVTAGQLKIAGDVFATTGDYNIAVSATNYTDATATQKIVEAKTPPTLTSTVTPLGSPVNLTFTDDAAWRAAISGITVNDAVYLTSSQYTVTAGNIQIAGDILTTGGSYSISVSAAKYTDASVVQIIDPGWIITTVAGQGGTHSYGGDGGPAASAFLNAPSGLSLDSNTGALYIADYSNNRIRKVDLSGTITTVAGTGTGGYSGDGGLATQAKINRPYDTVVDESGNLYIADYSNYRVRKVDPNGVITTVAGTGTSGYSGDGGPATSAKLYYPTGLALDEAGNLYITDSINARVRKVDPSGIITTVAGTGTSGYSGDGGPATQAQLGLFLYGIDVDQAGNLFIADFKNHRVRKVNLSTGKITTVAGNGTAATSGDGGPATQASLNNPADVAFDSYGNLFIAEASGNVVRMINAAGVISTIAGTAGTSGFSGDGGPAKQALLKKPFSVLYDRSRGGLYIADRNNAVIRFIEMEDVVARPVSDQPSGGLPDGTTVTLSTATAGAAIFYTTDGSTPTPASTLYSGPITVDLSSATTFTIKAVAVKAGIKDSVVVTYSYTLPYTVPTWPANTNVSAANITATGLTLNWTPAVDNVGVTGYQIYVNDSLLATVSDNTYDSTNLTAGTSYEFKLKAGNASGGWSDFSPALTAGTLPVLTAKSTDNVLGKAVDLTFTDDSAWRAAITGVTLDGTALDNNQYLGYTVSEGNINIVDGAFKTTGDHTIVVKATNYGDNTVVQTLNTPQTPPVLTADSVNNIVGKDVYVTFTDDSAWRAAITGVKINGVPLTSGQYTVAPGILNISAGALPALPGYYTVAVSSANYADTSVTEIIYGTTPGVAMVNPALKNLPDGYIVSVAGQGGQTGYSGDNGPATGALFYDIYGAALDKVGNLYIADRDNAVIRKVDVNGMVTTVAGNGVRSASGDGLPALQASMYPYCVAVDSKGNLLIGSYYDKNVRKVDTSGMMSTLATSVAPNFMAIDSSDNLYLSGSKHLIQKVDPNGVVTTVAGTGSSGFSGDGGPATEAQISSFFGGGVAFDQSGNLYIADTGNYRIREVAVVSGTQYGISMTAGNIYTIAGNGTEGSSGDGGPALQASLNPVGLTLDSEGNIYFANNGGLIRRVDKGGIITTVAGTGTAGFSGDNGSALQAQLKAYSLFYDQNAGGLYDAEMNNSCIRFIKLKPVAATPAVSLPDGAITTGNVVNLKEAASVTFSTATEGADIYYTTDGSTPTSAGTKYTGPVYISNKTTLKAISVKEGLTDSYVLTKYYQIGNTLPPVLTADSTDNVLGSAVDITFTDDPAWRGAITKVTVDDTALTSSQFTFSAGDLNLAAGVFKAVGDHTVAISAMGYQDTSVVQTVYATLDIPDGYITIFAGKPGTYGFSGDGGLATGAMLNNPSGMREDKAGNLYIADYGNYRVRKVDASGMITTVAGNGTRAFAGDDGPATQASLAYFTDIAVDGAGNLYIPDSDTRRIRKVDATTGIITTIAGNGTYGYSGDGGPATAAQLMSPLNIAADQAGNIYFNDGVRIREVAAVSGTQCGISMTAGNIYTIAGTGTSGYSGDGGPAAQAQFNTITGLTLDQSGNLYLLDKSNNRIRKVDTNGIINTVAGPWTSGGYAGDGGPVSAAQLNNPRGITIDEAGNFYFIDTNNYRVCKVDTSGIITTIAGNGTFGYSGDGGPATQATFKKCYHLTYGGVRGGLYISDGSGSTHAVRFIKLAIDQSPLLTPDSTNNTVGLPVEITFTDKQAWRDRITGITVDDTSIAGRYTVASGKITIDADVFSTAKVYSITVKATGYANVTVEQPVVMAAYALTPTTDSAYQSGTTPDGIVTMTVNTGVSGLKYFGVQITPMKSHSGLESVIFVQTGSQSGLNVTRADFDTVNIAKAGFNVLPGDVVKAYIVDDLTNDPNVNPTILQ